MEQYISPDLIQVSHINVNLSAAFIFIYLWCANPWNTSLRIHSDKIFIIEPRYLGQILKQRNFNQNKEEFTLPKWFWKLVS